MTKEEKKTSQTNTAKYTKFPNEILNYIYIVYY